MKIEERLKFITIRYPWDKLSALANALYWEKRAEWEQDQGESEEAAVHRELAKLQFKKAGRIGGAAEAESQRAVALKGLQRYEEAEAALRSVLSVRESEYHKRMASTKRDLANIVLSQEKYEEARRLLDESIEHAQKAEGSVQLVFGNEFLGRWYVAQEKFDEAIEQYEKTVQMANQLDGVNAESKDYARGTVWLYYVEVLEKADRKEEAKEKLQKAKEIFSAEHLRERYTKRLKEIGELEKKLLV